MRGYVLVLSLDGSRATYSEVGEFRGADLVESLVLPKLVLPKLEVTAESLLNPE